MIRYGTTIAHLIGQGGDPVTRSCRQPPGVSHGPELQAKHADLYQNAQLVVIRSAGHNMVWDHPEETLRVVRSFLQK